MSLFTDEPSLARYLKERLRGNYRKIHIGINLASHKFYDHWKEWWGDYLPPAQPEIDLLFVDRSLELLAVELKYFRKKEGKSSINYPFYEGIGESLSLLRFGFESVSLWQFYDRDIREVMSRYEPAASRIINELKLPINYQGFYLDEYQGEIQPYYISDGKPLIYLSEGKPISIVAPSPYGASNPLKDTENAKKMIDFLRMSLRIPRE